MKTTILSVLFSFVIFVACTQQDRTITEIQTDFEKWQSIIDSDLQNATLLYHYAWGENYQEQEWYAAEQTEQNKFLFQKAFIIERPELGTFVYYDNYAMSGDWTIAVDYYFNENDKLYFVFWRMNTFQAEEPLTIEKRLYFNTNGELIRNLESRYKMNTKEESIAGFSDRDVEYEMKLQEMNFYPVWRPR